VLKTASRFVAESKTEEVKREIRPSVLEGKPIINCGNWVENSTQPSKIDLIAENTDRRLNTVKLLISPVS
jgi:hypothetical protein